MGGSMRLKNKKTGEKAEVEISCNSMIVQYEDGRIVKYYFDSLKDLDEWEDAPEEPKEYWFLSGRGEIRCIEDEDTDFDNNHKEIGNYFSTQEEAEKAVEKLRAYKRLKDKGFRFDSYDVADRVGGDATICGQAYFKAGNYDREEIEDELYLLFGGEE